MGNPTESLVEAVSRAQLGLLWRECKAVASRATSRLRAEFLLMRTVQRAIEAFPPAMWSDADAARKALLKSPHMGILGIRGASDVPIPTISKELQGRLASYKKFYMHGVEVTPSDWYNANISQGPPLGVFQFPSDHISDMLEGNPERATANLAAEAREAVKELRLHAHRQEERKVVYTSGVLSTEGVGRKILQCLDEAHAEWERIVARMQEPLRGLGVVNLATQAAPVRHANGDNTTARMGAPLRGLGFVDWMTPAAPIYATLGAGGAGWAGMDSGAKGGDLGDPGDGAPDGPPDSNGDGEAALEGAIRLALDADREAEALNAEIHDMKVEIESLRSLAAQHRVGLLLHDKEEMMTQLESLTLRLEDVRQRKAYWMGVACESGVEAKKIRAMAEEMARESLRRIVFDHREKQSILADKRALDDEVRNKEEYIYRARSLVPSMVLQISESILNSGHRDVRVEKKSGALSIVVGAVSIVSTAPGNVLVRWIQHGLENFISINRNPAPGYDDWTGYKLGVPLEDVYTRSLTVMLEAMDPKDEQGYGAIRGVNGVVNISYDSRNGNGAVRVQWKCPKLGIKEERDHTFVRTTHTRPNVWSFARAGGGVVFIK